MVNLYNLNFSGVELPHCDSHRLNDDDAAFWIRLGGALEVTWD